MTIDPVPSPAAVSRNDLVLRAEALRSGMSDRAFTRLTRSGEYVKVWRGCLMKRTRWDGLSERGRLLARHLAYAAASPSRVVFDGPSALLLLGYRLHRDPTELHVTGPHYPRPHDPGVKGHRFYGEDFRTERVLGGVEVVEEPRAVVDAALRGRVRDAVVHVDQALRRGVPRERLGLLLEGMAGRTGIGIARRGLELADGASESVLESVCRYELVIGGVPAPETQVRVETPAGPKFLDLGWQEQRLGLEVDGVGKYFDARPTSEAIHAEHVRERRIRAEGWEILRTDASEIYRRPGELVARVLAVLRARSRH